MIRKIFLLILLFCLVSCYSIAPNSLPTSTSSATTTYTPSPTVIIQPTETVIPIPTKDAEGLIIVHEVIAESNVDGLSKIVTFATDSSIALRVNKPVVMEFNPRLTRNAAGEFDINRGTPDFNATVAKEAAPVGWMHGMWHVWLANGTDEQKAATTAKFGKMRTEQNFPFDEWMKMVVAYKNNTQYNGQNVMLDDVSLQIYATDGTGGLSRSFDPTLKNRVVLTNDSKNMTVFQNGLAFGSFIRPDNTFEMRFIFPTFYGERTASNLTDLLVMGLIRLSRGPDYSKIGNVNVDLSKILADGRNFPDIGDSMSRSKQGNQRLLTNFGPLMPSINTSDTGGLY